MKPERNRVQEQQIFEDSLSKLEKKALKRMTEAKQSDVEIVGNKHGKLRLRDDGAWVSEIGGRSKEYLPSMHTSRDLLFIYTILTLTSKNKVEEVIDMTKDPTRLAVELAASIYLEQPERKKFLRRGFLGKVTKAVSRLDNLKTT